MIIQHLSKPFYHTIIHGFIASHDKPLVLNEIESLDTPASDPHHMRLQKENNTDAFSLDGIFSADRSKSKILSVMSKAFQMKLHEHDNENPFLGYVPITNKDLTMVQKYKNGSQYFPHHDNSVLTFLCPITVGKYTGGRLTFCRHDYAPEIPPDGCLVFPSHEIHQLEKIKTRSKGYVRYSINMRVFIGS